MLLHRGKRDSWLEHERIKELLLKRDVQGLVKEFKHADTNGVQQIATALGQLGDPRAVDSLLSILANGSKSEQVTAAEALGKIGDRRALEPLVDALRHSADASLRFSAAHALGDLRDPRAGQPLLDAYASDEGEGSTQPKFAAADALAMIGGPEIVDALIGMIQAGPASKMGDYCYGEAFDLLGRIGDPRAVDALVSVLGKDRAHAVRALVRIGDPRAIEPLTRAMDAATDDRVRTDFSQALEAIRRKNQ